MHKTFFIFLSFFLIAGCNLINPEEKIPAYLYVEPFSLKDNPDIQAGSLDHRISHVYAYSGSEFLGIFSLPALIPVLQEGSQELLLDPAIRENGISSSAQIYPFYERYAQQVSLEPGKTDTIRPVTRYRSNIKIHFIEDFETGLPIFSEDRDGNTQTFVDLTTEDVYEGAKSGLVYLDTANILFDVATDRDQEFSLKEGGRVFLEVSYKTDIDIIFGLVEIDNFGNTQSYYEYGLKPRDTWNKVYFNLTDLVRVTNADGYQVVITGGLPLSNGQFSLTEARVYLDNIKLISF